MKIKRRNPLLGAVVLALAAAVGLLMPSGAARAQPLPVHYVLYAAPATAPTSPWPVDLLTDFGLEEDVVVDPNPIYLAPPAIKNGEGVLDIPHLRFFNIDEPAPSPTRYVTVRDQFGTYEHLQVGAAYTLALPTIKDPVEPDLPPTPMYEDWHYKCYFLPETEAYHEVYIETQFHEPGFPEYTYTNFLFGLCLPAGKDGAAIPDAPYLTMYALGQPLAAPQWLVNLDHQFGAEGLVPVYDGNYLMNAAEVVEAEEPVHYVLWESQAPEPLDPPPPSVDLLTDFGLEEDVEVYDWPYWLATPAIKNGEGTLELPHLRFFEIYGEPPSPTRYVTVTDQFGTYEDLEIMDPVLLGVPTIKDPIEPDLDPTPLYHDDWHYKCYRVPFTEVYHEVTVLTQFQPAGPEYAEVAFLWAVCLPADKNNENGGVIPDAPALTLYEFGTGLTAPGWVVGLEHQFGTETVPAVGPGWELLVEAEVTELPPKAPHYACYIAPPLTPYPIEPVTLLTQFGLETEVEVYDPWHLCLPALKNGEGDLTAPHLRTFWIDEPAPEPERRVNLVTQFGSYEDVAVGPAILLAVPTQKDVLAPVPSPGQPVQPDDPHYKCYNITGPPAGDVVRVYTQFEALTTGEEQYVEVGEPVALCAPADKNFEQGGQIPDTPHLVCYWAGLVPPAQFIVNLLHQFWDEFEVGVYEGELLCVPALKTEADDGIADVPEDDYAAAPLGGAVNSVPESKLAGTCGDGIDNDTDGFTDASDLGCDPLNVDSDGDTIADVDERSLDSNPYDGTLTPESQLAGTCADGIDNDGDGRIDLIGPGDSGCKTTDSDSDGFTDYDERGLGSVWLEEMLEALDSDDNCPGVYNPDQANNDGRQESSGPFIPGGVRGNTTGDTLGDACDPDDDNDGLSDIDEGYWGTDPYVKDTDGDRCIDGVEVVKGTDPLDPASKCGLLTVWEQDYFKCCHISGPGDTDPDGDGILCPFTTPPPTGDKDADDGSSMFRNLCANPVCTEIEDLVEVRGYGSAPAVPDTDADGCEDWIEITDINGDRAANALDAGTIDLRLAGAVPADPVSDAVFDLNKDGVLNALDPALAVLNSGDIKGNTGNPANCLPVTTDLQR